MRWLGVLFLMVSTVYAQDIYYYNRRVGDTVVIAWDAVNIEICCKNCATNQSVCHAVTPGQTTFDKCGRSTDLTWDGNRLTYTQYDCEGNAKTWTGQMAYHWWMASPERPQIVAGTTLEPQASIVLDYPHPVIGVAVKAVLNDQESDPTWSDGPYATVDGQPRYWLLSVAEGGLLPYDIIFQKW